MYSGIREFFLEKWYEPISRKISVDYDATSFAPTESAPVDFHQTVFPVTSESVMKAAGKLATKRREKKAFTVSFRILLRDLSY